MPLELAHDAGALDRVVDLGIGRIDVGGQRALLQHPVGRILEGRQHVLGGDAEPARERFGEPVRVVGRRPSPRASRSRSARRRCQIGLPSVRQSSENAQRGSASPGYHLPCP